MCPFKSKGNGYSVLADFPSIHIVSYSKFGILTYCFKLEDTMSTYRSTIMITIAHGPNIHIFLPHYAIIYLTSRLINIR